MVYTHTYTHTVSVVLSQALSLSLIQSLKHTAPARQCYEDAGFVIKHLDRPLLLTLEAELILKLTIGESRPRNYTSWTWNQNDNILGYWKGFRLGRSM